MAREDVVAHMMPLEPKLDQMGSIIREAVRLRLLKEESGSVALADGVRPRDVKDDNWFADFMDRALFGRLLNYSDDNRPAAFAVSWLLTRPTIPELQWRQDLAAAMRTDMDGDDTYDVINVDRAAMLSYWAHFTGYAEAFGLFGKTFLIPDPTRAIERRLAEVFGREAALAFPRFQNSLASLAPVLEGGAVRAQVEERLHRKREPSHVSQATSLALLRLEARNAIALEARSDAPHRTLDLGAQGTRSVSHILWKGAA